MTRPNDPEPDQRMQGPDEAPQQPVRPGAASAISTRQAPQAPAPTGVDADDDPSPPTTPVYLRSTPRQGTAAEPRAQAGGPAQAVVVPPAEAAAAPATDAVAALPAFDARKQTLTAQSAAIVDSITAGLADALALSLRPVVASTVEALIPMILSLGSVPDEDDDAAAVPATDPATAQ